MSMSSKMVSRRRGLSRTRETEEVDAARMGTFWPLLKRTDGDVTHPYYK